MKTVSILRGVLVHLNYFFFFNAMHIYVINYTDRPRCNLCISFSITLLKPILCICHFFCGVVLRIYLVLLLKFPYASGVPSLYSSMLKPYWLTGYEGGVCPLRHSTHYSLILQKYSYRLNYIIR